MARYAGRVPQEFRAKIQELDDAREVFASGRVGIPVTSRTSAGKSCLMHAPISERAVGDEELQ